MIKNILSVGDSFTYGEELPDRETQAYPALLAKKLGASSNNMGKPGSGNKRMIRYVMDQIAAGAEIDLVTIGWTSSGRMEFADEDGFFDVWPGYRGNMFKRDGQLWRVTLLEYVDRHHDPEYLYKQHLLDVILLQAFLKQQGIKYVMLNILFNEFYHQTYYSKMAEFTRMIDGTDYLGWPDSGMGEWTFNKCDVGPNGHFLETGHQIVADKLYEHIRNRGWVS